MKFTFGMFFTLVLKSRLSQSKREYHLIVHTSASAIKRENLLWLQYRTIRYEKVRTIIVYYSPIRENYYIVGCILDNQALLVSGIMN